MFTRYDKAAAAALSSAFVGMLLVFKVVTPVEATALGTFLNALSVFLVPNLSE